MIYDIALTLIPKVGCRTAIQLISAFGSAQKVLEASYDELKAVGVSNGVIESLGVEQPMQRAQTIMEHCSRSGIRVLTRWMEEYPALLRECEDAPQVLYVRGNIDFNQGRWVSVVGTRNATSHGLCDAEGLVTSLAAAYDNVVIVSGMAFGIDKAAHTSALNHDVPTVAVMPGWVDDITPTSHFYVARRILQSGGAVVSDMPPQTVIGRSNFLSRNRIIAGLSHTTVVVESAAKGGSLITADIALSYNREVFAIPGRSDDANCQGTNNLIKSSRAILYQDISDIAETMGWQRDKRATQTLDTSNLPKPIQELFCVMPDTAPITMEELCQSLNIVTADASSRLMHLEVRGFIKSLPGRLYQKAKY